MGSDLSWQSFFNKNNQPQPKKGKNNTKQNTKGNVGSMKQMNRRTQ